MTALDRFLLFVALPAVVLASLVEALVLSRRQGYDWKAAGVSLTDLVLRVATQLLLPLSIATPLIAWAYQHRLADIALDGWAAFVLLFIGQEFCYYGFHRAAHRVRWFWCNHAVHHSPNELNLSAAYRIGFLGRATGSSVFYVPLVWLGFPPRVVFAMLSLNLLYQFWIHATWIPRLGWLEGWVNTPSAHRVHHAANLDYLDANYGGVLLVFDRLFGTYKPERDELPCRYGLVTPLVSYNPLTVEFHQWLLLARDLSKARRLRTVLGLLFRPPGWNPHGRGTTTEELRAAARRGDAGARPSPPAATAAAG
ncbi:sterol desaturase family protein [Aquabacterium sp. J223]|uniref:sterol desaturase family protein n=1 Tax=Aquabacterium sp. J223 TaxID=2898431 RepID=UPI0021ADA44E|nr:sterol desaturase family protein [Aquabacterium sp. J223]UUX94700.1 sterol desaturase family protein [Aquabacterium sp. J223]